MKKAQSGNLQTLILISLLAVAVSTAGYFYLQTQKLQSKPAPAPVSSPIVTPSATPTDETVGWKIYTDVKNRFAFKYPVTMTVSTTGFINGSLTIKNNDFNSSNWRQSYQIEAQVFPNPTDLNQLMAMACKSAMTGKMIPCTMTRYEKDNYNVTMIEYGKGFEESKNYFIFGKNLGMGFYGSGTNHGAYHKTLDQILSTFKFD